MIIPNKQRKESDMDRKTLRGVILYMIVMGTFCFTLLYAMTAKSEDWPAMKPTCANVERALVLAPQTATLRTETALRKMGFDECVQGKAKMHLRNLRRYCRQGLSIGEAERRSLELLTTLCELERDRNEQ